MKEGGETIIVLYASFGFSEGWVPTILPMNHNLCKVDVVRALPGIIHSLNPVIYVKITSQLTIEVVCYGAVKITQSLGNLRKIKPTRLPKELLKLTHRYKVLSLSGDSVTILLCLVFRGSNPGGNNHGIPYHFTVLSILGLVSELVYMKNTRFSR